MRPEAPHIVIENGLEYPLGVLKNREIHYNFTNVKNYLEFKAGRLFGTHFRFYEEDLPILKKLIYYIIGDLENCQRHSIDPKKGILLTGPVGCGKTSFMQLIKHIVPYQRPYSLVPTRELVFSFNRQGHKIISDFGSHNYYCFDDLGVEPVGRHFGQECNVMGEILLSRYDLYVNHKVKSHLTSNLNAAEIESRYGNRVRSRMRQLFNLIAFDNSSKDKR